MISVFSSALYWAPPCSNQFLIFVFGFLLVVLAHTTYNFFLFYNALWVLDADVLSAFWKIHAKGKEDAFASLFFFLFWVHHIDVSTRENSLGKWSSIVVLSLSAHSQWPLTIFEIPCTENYKNHNSESRYKST